MTYTAVCWPESLSHVDSAEIKRLVACGESSRLELKSGVPQPDVIAREIAALANTEGGVLLIGVQEPASFVGVDQERVRRALELARGSLSPIPNVTLESVEVDGKAVSVIRVQRSNWPVAARGGFFLRADSQVRPLSATEIRRRASDYHSADRALDVLSQAITRQTTEIVRLQADFARANSLFRKLGIAAAAAVVGALLKIVIEHL